ncbi:MAG: pirin family protein [Rhodospirillaceae bacterium]
MIERRSFASLGQFRNEWLHARHHFSFGQYYDPNRMGVGSLRVWNDDVINPGTGFDPHPHQDMEIITYIRKGAITHQDSMGNRGRTGAGDVQVMWAGSGIVHAEYNLEAEETILFQIWIETAQPGLKPGWTQQAFPQVEDRLVVLASGRTIPGHDSAPRIHQDAALLGAVLSPGASVSYPIQDRMAYLVADHGMVSTNGEDAMARDGVLIRDEETLTVTAGPDGAEIVFADVA